MVIWLDHKMFGASQNNVRPPRWCFWILHVEWNASHHKKKGETSDLIKWTQIHKSGMEINWVIPPIYMILGEIARERKQKHYPLVNQLFAIENGPVEIVDLPIKKH